MSKQAEAGLILKLYDLRREATMRTGREWFFREFHPQSFDDVKTLLLGEHSGHLRMVLTYWDMAAGLVNHGAIPLDLFNDTNGEHFSVFAKMEPFIAQWRAAFGPQFLANLEKVVDATQDGRKRVARIREMLNKAPALLASKQAESA
jgi:hypothetical protein